MRRAFLLALALIMSVSYLYSCRNNENDTDNDVSANENAKKSDPIFDIEEKDPQLMAKDIEVTVDGRPVDEESVIHDGTTYLSVRPAESLGIEVGWGRPDDAPADACGDELTWNFDEKTGTLTISGSGKMWNFVSYNQYSGQYTDEDTPWKEYSGSIKKIEFKGEITSIGGGAFNGCYNVRTVNIPKSVEEINNRAFVGCQSLFAFIVDEENEYFSANGPILCSKDGTRLVCYPAGTENESFDIPNGIKTVDDYAFHGSGLTEVTVPESVENIGLRAFDACSLLEDIDVSKDNKFYSDDNGILFNKDKTELIFYPAGKNKSTYTVPESVETVGHFAFTIYDCPLEKIVLPDGLRRIEEFAFFICMNLTSVDLPKNVTDIGIGAFGICPKLESITVDKNNEVFTDVDGVLYTKDMSFLVFVPPMADMKEFAIPNTVTKIGYGAFNSNTKLEKLTIPVSVKRIMPYAFENFSVSDVYYDGSDEDWAKITVDEGNEPLTEKADIYYNIK